MIFSFLSRLFRRGGHTERQRAIFSFWDGARLKRVDPLVVHRAMWSHPTCRIEADFKAADNGDNEAFDRIIAMTREIFGVSAWSEETEGLTIGETRALLLEFLAYVDVKKKAPESLPPASPPSASESSPAESSDSITEPASDSFSTKTLLNGAELTISSKRSRKPWEVELLEKSGLTP